MSRISHNTLGVMSFALSEMLLSAVRQRVSKRPIWLTNATLPKVPLPSGWKGAPE